MDEQFDNDLKNRIKEVFENLDDSAAGEGWLQLRKKYPEEQPNRRPFAWIWWSAAAAILLIFFGIGLLLNNEQGKHEKLSTKITKPVQTENPAVVKNKDHHPANGNAKSVNGEKPAKAIAGNATLNPSTLAGNKKPVQLHVTARVFSNDTAGKNMLAAKKTTGSSKNVVSKPTALQLAATQQKNAARVLPNAATVQSNTAPVQQNTATVQANAAVVQKNSATVQSNAATAQSNAAIVSPNPPNSNPATLAVTTQPAAKKTIATMFAEDRLADAQKKPEKLKNDTKRVHFGVYATSYFNYARGSSNQVNAGAGFTSDIAITKNLKIVTGVGIGQNTLSYGAGDNSNAIVNGAFPGSSGNFYLASAGAAPGANTPKIASYSVLEAPTVKNYSANLVGIDIPINLKYDFNPKKNDLYISAGLSSGTFINESYTYQYNSPSFFSPSTQQTLGETTNRSFNGFYLAKTLNVAFGVGYPFGKNRLIIEPFLKYPLEGLGSQDIRFGAGGINLKFNFESLHK